MTTSHNPPATQPQPGPPTVRQRARPSLIAMGLTLFAVFGLAGYFFATKGGSPQTVVVATKPLTAGQPITADQLSTTQITGGTNAATIDSVKLNSLPGLYPVGDIPAGTILNSDGLVNKLTPLEDESIVAVGVKPSQIPSIGVVHGDKVTLVVTHSQSAESSSTTPGQDAPSGDASVTPGRSWTATVISVGEPSDDQTRTVDVSLPKEAASDLAAATGTGRMSIVITHTVNGR